MLWINGWTGWPRGRVERGLHRGHDLAAFPRLHVDVGSQREGYHVRPSVPRKDDDRGRAVVGEERVHRQRRRERALAGVEDDKRRENPFRDDPLADGPSPVVFRVGEAGNCDAQVRTVPCHRVVSFRSEYVRAWGRLTTVAVAV